MSPLAKSHAQGRFSNGFKDIELDTSIPSQSIVDPRAAPYLSERFELFINGMEFINAYSE